MAQNLYQFIAFVCLWQMVARVRATGLYSIVGPGTIRSNFKYNVVVSVHKAEEPCQIKVGIIGPLYNDSKTIEVQPMSTQSVEFDVPALKTGNYNLTAVGLSGIKFENSTELNYKDYQPLVFIQTDKATYKPGDLVQFRVLFLDANTRPARVSNPITIAINDGAQNRIKQLKDIQLTKGVYTDELQLSEQPVLGNWEIEVNVGGENPTTKSFEVARYVLPKFEVSVDSAKDVAIPDGVIKVTVRSKYTYGKSVKGKATISIKPSYNYYGDSNSNLEAEKTIDIDGKGHVEFDLTKDLHVSPERTYVPPLKIVAVVEEELTGNRQNATTSINLHAERYRIESIDTPYTYHPDKPTIFKVVVKNLDGSPVQDAKNKAKLIVDPPRNYFYRGLESGTEKPDEKSLEFESNLNEHGIATFEFTLPENNNSFYSVKCKFIDTVSYLSSLSKFTPSEEQIEMLKLTVNTEKPQFGKDVSVNVQSADNIPYLVYTLVARGNILKTERVNVAEGTKSHTIKFTPTFAMIPKATLFVHYVFGNNLRFEEKDINFEKEFENSIDITAQPQAKPGEEVKLVIKSDPDSFIGLLGVDQSVLLLKSGNDLSKEDIFRNLVDFDTHTPYIRGYGRYPGQESGLVTMTNAHYPYSDDATLIYFTPDPIPEEELLLHDFDLIAVAHDLAEDNFSDIEYFAEHLRTKPTKPPPVHTDYTAVWMCTDAAMPLEANSDANGFTLTKKIPDTITSWVITGFALNPKTGLALTENPTKIQVFQPFFVSTNLPYSVKRGEVISIPVVIFNYMDKTLDAEVSMDNNDKEFEFTEATNEIEEHPLNDVKRVKRVTVPSNTGRGVSFMIRPKKVGQTTLKIAAVTALAGDAVHQTLKVEPEGVTQFENRAVLINLNGKPEYSNKLAVDIPAEAVLDSEYIEFSIVGDLLGPTIKNLDKLVRMPYGCGEQNMVNFVPNILVLKYFETIQKDLPNIAEKAKKFLEIGYQRELTYKHGDGSYSAFGKSDVAGSTWLTAYVVRSFHQAAEYTDIDPKVIVEGLDFLAASQASNGSFPENGKLFDSAHQNELGLTAFVLLAFFENVEHIAKYQEQIDKGVKYLLANVDKSDDQYALSISALALQMAKNPSVDKLLAKLQTLAMHENDRKWWSKKEVKEDNGDKLLSRWRPNSNAVEITSYVLLALLQQEAAESALPIVKWLISQRNSNGGFSSTQDTVVGLQALIKFSEKAGSGVGDMNIDFVSKGGSKTNGGSVRVNKDNSLVLQTHVLPKTSRLVEFTAKGNGSAMVQLSYRYNVADKDKAPSFKVKATVNDDLSSRKLNVEVCAEYVPLPDADGKGKESNMAVMEVALPSGYTADTDSFDKIELVDRVKRTESKNSNSMVIVYFDSFTAGEITCIPVDASKTHAVAKQKPAAISVYDYYDTSRRATEYYGVKSSLCDICDGDDCGAACKKQ